MNCGSLPPIWALGVCDGLYKGRKADDEAERLVGKRGAKEKVLRGDHPPKPPKKTPPKT